MVKLLLEMKAGLDTVMEEAFAKDERFGHALKDAFEHFVNQRANRCSRPPHSSTHSTAAHIKAQSVQEGVSNICAHPFIPFAWKVRNMASRDGSWSLSVQCCVDTKWKHR